MNILRKPLLFLYLVSGVSCITVASDAYKDSSVHHGSPASGSYDGSMYKLTVECNHPETMIFFNGLLYGQTDMNGRFSLKLRSAAYDFKAVKKGFEPYTGNLRLDRDRVIRFSLKPIQQ